MAKDDAVAKADERRAAEIRFQRAREATAKATRETASKAAAADRQKK